VRNKKIFAVSSCSDVFYREGRKGTWNVIEGNMKWITANDNFLLWGLDE
jgi:hypothetical protein